MKTQDVVSKLLDLASRPLITKADNAQEVMRIAAEMLSAKNNTWKSPDDPPKSKKPVIVWRGGNDFAVVEYRVSTWEDVVLWMDIPLPK